LADIQILRDLGVILVGATVFVLLARPLRIPSIVAYMLAGLFLGPVIGLVEVSEAVELVSELGIVLLLFLVGLELSFAKIKDVGKVAVWAGLGQVVFTAAGGLAIAWLLGFDWIQSLFIATALTFSSTVVVVKLLDQKKELDSLYGRIAVGIFLVQDLVVVVVLTFLAGLGREGGGAGLELGPVLQGLGAAFGGMGILLVLALVASRWLLPRGFEWVARSPEALLVWSLAWCFVFVVTAHALGLSVEIGAFLAGISLAQLPYSHETRRRVHPLMNFFIAVFFVTLGVQMELGAAVEQAPAALVLSLFVLLGNPFIFMVIITRLRFDERTAFLTSVTVAQISEFSFIFAALGVSTGLIGGEILSLVALVGLVTIAVSAYMILFNHQLYALLDRWRVLRVFRARRDENPEEPEVRQGHVVVVGMNSLGRRIVEALHEAGEETLAIDIDPVKLKGLPGEGMMGNTDYLSVLEEAGLGRAKLLVSALQIQDANNLLAYRCRILGVPCSIHAFDRSVVPELRTLEATHLIASKAMGTRRIMEVLHDEGVYG